MLSFRACFILLLARNYLRRRAYYVTHRDRILALNKQCKLRRQHLWKRERGRRIRRKQPRAFRYCAECGQPVLCLEATRFGALQGRHWWVCRECYPWEHPLEHVPPFPKHDKERRQYLENYHLFLYGDGLERSEEEDRLEMHDEDQRAWARVALEDARHRNQADHFIFVAYYAEQKTLAEIGKVFRMTRERIRQRLRRVQCQIQARVRFLKSAAEFEEVLARRSARSRKRTKLGRGYENSEKTKQVCSEAAGRGAQNLSLVGTDSMQEVPVACAPPAQNDLPMAGCNVSRLLENESLPLVSSSALKTERQEHRA